jgi:hypothetical protein
MCPDPENDIQVVAIDPTPPQGWYDPDTGEYLPADHTTMYQYNITGIRDPFLQQIGTIYWLEICVETISGEWGWKSSQDHWEDDAVWRLGSPWVDLYEPPLFTQSLDLAFVITEKRVPTVSQWGLIMLVLLLVGIAGVLIIRRRARSRSAA